MLVLRLFAGLLFCFCRVGIAGFSDNKYFVIRYELSIYTFLGTTRGKYNVNSVPFSTLLVGRLFHNMML